MESNSPRSLAESSSITANSSQSVQINGYGGFPRYYTIQSPSFHAEDNPVIRCVARSCCPNWCSIVWPICNYPGIQRCGKSLKSSSFAQSRAITFSTASMINTFSSCCNPSDRLRPQKPGKQYPNLSTGFLSRTLISIQIISKPCHHTRCAF